MNDQNRVKNRSMPDCTIIPVLTYNDLPKAIEWLCKTFGFTERWRAGNHRAQLAFGGGAIAVTGQSQDITLKDSSGFYAHSLLVRVEDVQSHYDHTQQSGAEIIQAPTEYPYGEKQYSVKDPGGHIWIFSQSIADVAPEEWGGVTAKL